MAKIVLIVDASGSLSSETVDECVIRPGSHVALRRHESARLDTLLVSETVIPWSEIKKITVSNDPPDGSALVD